MPAEKIAKLVGHLKTPEDCEQVAINVEAKDPAFAIAARRKAVELKAATHHAATEAEQHALEAVYAYERVLFLERGKKIRATHTWQMFKKLGIVPAVETIVKTPTAKAGYDALLKMGMQDWTFEAVVLRHPDVFSADAVERSKQRLDELTATA
jgi:hypothetical protein